MGGGAPGTFCDATAAIGAAIAVARNLECALAGVQEEGTMARNWIAIATLALAGGAVGCAGDLSSPSSTEQDTRSCHHNNRWCTDGGVMDMASPPPDLASPPDLAHAVADLATTPPPPDLASPPPDLATSCDKAVTTTDTGHHNAGADCTSCHNGGGGPTKWYVSGTLYDSVTGTNPIAGATIHVTDAAGQKLTLISALNGNFYTGTAVTYPVTVSASRCPSTVAMSGQVQAPGGCNGCHSSTFRIHLP